MSVEFEWSVTGAPKTTQLTGVESRGDVVVASGRRGLLAERTGPGEWDALFNSGPTGNGHGILDAALTDDGGRAWYCGNSGSFGYYDFAQRTPKPHSGPSNLTSAFRSIAVNGAAGEERVVAVDGNGQFVWASMEGESMTVETVATPGDGTALTEIVDDSEAFYAADVAGSLYRSSDGDRWRRRRLTDRTVKSLALGDAGLAAIDENGTVYRDVSLFERDTPTETAHFGATSPEELAAEGDDFVIGGCDGCVVPVLAAEEAVHPDPGPGVTYYGTEILDDGTVVAVGSSGTITEGIPA